MRYSAVVLVLVINTALAKADEGDPGAGYTYQINASRVSQLIAPTHPIFWMYYQIAVEQNITYYRSLDPEHPLLLENYLTSSDTVYFVNTDTDLLNTCDSYGNDTWEYVIVEIVKKGVIPGGTCSVKKGSYMISKKVAPVTATFSQMIQCGQYMLVNNFFVINDLGDKIWGGQLEFDFYIPEDGRCL